MSEIIEYEEPGTDLVVQQPAPPTLFGTDNPAEVVRAATEAAKPLADVVRKQRLSVRIGQSEHVRVEGWTMLGSMLGVFPVCTWTRKLDDGWEARVEARTRDGALVGAAEAECLRSERTWASRDDYALRSMAQTRATSKALRQPLGFVMQLAGFNPTPAEEMPSQREVSAGDPRAERTPAPAAYEHPSPAEKPSAQKTELPGETFEEIFDEAADPDADKVSLSAAQRKKLDVLVGQLRDAGRITTQQLYHSIGLLRDVDPDDLAKAMPGAIDAEGVLHYSALRETLSKAEASNIIDRLQKLQDAQ